MEKNATLNKWIAQMEKDFSFSLLNHHDHIRELLSPELVPKHSFSNPSPRK